MFIKIEKIDKNHEKIIKEISILERNIFFKSAYSIETLKNFLKDEKLYRIYCSLDENLRVVAYLIVADNLDSYDILKIGVEEKYRSQKIADKLIEKIIDKEIFLEVRKSNLRAIKFYEKNEFVKISERKNYYKDNNEEAFIMLRRLKNE